QLAVGKDAVQREPVAGEVVARGVEDEEVDSGLRALLQLLGIDRVLERVVERVEVGPDRNRSAFRVAGAVRPELILGETRCDLDRRAVADAASPSEVAAHVGHAMRLLPSLGNGLSVWTSAKARAEGARLPLLDVY